MTGTRLLNYFLTFARWGLFGGIFELLYYFYNIKQ
nr:MAG TPA: hypothetical protein [Bacteriophage sp.]